jgi:hypothetical protein
MLLAPDQTLNESMEIIDVVRPIAAETALSLDTI